MFQDIPNEFDINFDGREIDEKAYVLCYDGEKVLCRIDGGAEFPRIGNLKDRPETVFAFSADGIRYFLCLSGRASAEGFEYKSLKAIRGAAQDINKFAAITGFHYYKFHGENRFCGRCGGKLVHDPEKRCMLCGNCGNEVFPKISPAVIVGIIDPENDSIVLTKYADRDYKKYALVAGFAEMGESAEDAVKREVMEETGLEITELKYYKSQPWGLAQNLLIGFFGYVKGSRRIIMDKNELSEAVWVSREKLQVGNEGVSLTEDMMRAFKEGRI